MAASSFPDVRTNWWIHAIPPGAVPSYGTSLREVARHMADYADSIFRGADPGDLPMKAALAHELAVNLQTARQLGINVPSEILVKANQFIR